MKIIKWKLIINNIADIKRILIFSVNQNNIINIVKEKTELYFYTLLNQKKLLIQIDEKIIELDLNEDTHNVEINSVVKAVLFYKKINTQIYEDSYQNKIDDRYIYCRSYNSLAPEYTNKLYFLIIRDILNHRYFGSDYISAFLTYAVGYFLKSNISSFLIRPFINHYNINENNYIVKGPTFNDFFIRELKTPLKVFKNNDIIYAPTSSRAMCYNYKNFYKLKLYIKGKKFSLSKLLDEKKLYTKYSIIICRLAINDYHHLHMPEDGILIKIKEFNGTYISVDKDYLKSEINVLNDNKRVVMKFKRTDGSKFYLIMVGSILVSSIVHNVELNKKYYTCEKIAYFQYGGSCVVYVSDKNIHFDDDLLYFSNEEIESYIKVGEQVGNLKQSRPLPYIKNYRIKRHVIGFINQLIECIVKLFIKINNTYFKNLNFEIV
jgi:phosphatidylserine decarboxylase